MLDKAQDDDLVMSVVELALDRPAGERSNYLLGACDGDGELFAQVWGYVEWEERMNGFLLDPLYTPALNEHPFEAGDLLDNRFRIVREVAQGGMGIVYEAVDEKLDVRRAIKCGKTGFRKRLPPEARNATAISHPNVCKIFEIHTASSRQGEIDFLSMEFLEGETLADRVARGPVPDAEARVIARQICAGLAAAHQERVIHGDLKTSNIILTKGGDGAARAVITDFGLAQPADAALWAAQSGADGGTPDYMAPELWKGAKPSVASDLYALGVILHELGSGRRPFEPDTPWEERLSRRPAPVNPKWDRVLGRCLDPVPTRRFSSADEVAEALTPHSRRWMLAAVAAALLVAISGVVTYEGVTAPVQNLRLAVLPFEASAVDRSLGDGLLRQMTEELQRVKASRSRRLTIIPLDAALQNKLDRPEKAVKLLGATHVLYGALRRDGGRALIHAYLTDARSQIPLKEWQAVYQPDELQGAPVALAGMITGTLRLPPLAVAVGVNAAAFTDFTSAIGLLERNRTDQAIALLENAVKADPDSPLTHARLAEAHALKYASTREVRWLEQAIVSLGDARQRNPDLAQVLLVSAMVDQYRGSYERAEADLSRALEIEPQNGDVATPRPDLPNRQPRRGGDSGLPAGDSCTAWLLQELSSFVVASLPLGKLRGSCPPMCKNDRAGSGSIGKLLC